MKTLLVPTDLTERSNHAVEYAAKMAATTHTKIILLHVFHIPAMPTDAPVILPDIESIEKKCNEDLQKIQQRLSLSYGRSLQIESVCVCGFASEEIIKYADSVKPDLIIMGITGTNYVTERLLGSVATSVVEDSKYPTLLVGHGIEFKVPQKVLLACDYNETGNSEVVKPLVKLAKLFKSHISVLNVEKELEPTGPAGEIVFEYKRLETALADVDHTFHFIGTDDVTKGINEFASMSNIDMIAMMPKKHSVLDKILSEPNTKKMAFHSKVPLLTLPNQNKHK